MLTVLEEFLVEMRQDNAVTQKIVFAGCRDSARDKIIRENGSEVEVIKVQPCFRNGDRVWTGKEE